MKPIERRIANVLSRIAQRCSNGAYGHDNPVMGESFDHEKFANELAAALEAAGCDIANMDLKS